MTFFVFLSLENAPARDDPAMQAGRFDRNRAGPFFGADVKVWDFDLARQTALRNFCLTACGVQLYPDPARYGAEHSAAEPFFLTQRGSTRHSQAFRIGPRLRKNGKNPYSTLANGIGICYNAFVSFF